jgi:hypothetical protein
MKKTKHCKICNSVIEKVTTNNSYCGESCRIIGERQVKSKWKITHPHKVKQYNDFYNNTPERKEYMVKYRRTPEALQRERESGLRYYKKNRHVEKNGHLKRTFNITLDDYNRMLEDQNGVCAICKRTETRKSKLGELWQLSVDHCHDTGKVRGLLCFACNSSLGKFKDSIETLQNAIEYLKRSKEDSE